MQPFLLRTHRHSLRYHDLDMSIGGYITITGYMIMVIWPDERHTVVQDLLLSLYAPFLYFAFFLMDTGPD